MIEHMPWFMSAMTILMSWMAGNKSLHAWAIGIANQAMWAGYSVATEQYGFLLATAFLTLTYARNWWKWRTA